MLPQPEEETAAGDSRSVDVVVVVDDIIRDLFLRVPFRHEKCRDALIGGTQMEEDSAAAARSYLSNAASGSRRFIRPVLSLLRVFRGVAETRKKKKDPQEVKHKEASTKRSSRAFKDTRHSRPDSYFCLMSSTYLRILTTELPKVARAMTPTTK